MAIFRGVLIAVGQQLRLQQICATILAVMKMGLRLGETELWTMSEAAKKVGVSRNALWRAVKRGELGTVQVGPAKLVTPEAVTAWVKTRYRADMAKRVRRRWQRARKRKK